MNKQTIGKLFLLLILTVLLIGIASATDTNNKTNTNKNTIEKSLQNTQPIKTNEINKHNTTTNTKTSTKKTPTKLTINKIKTVEFSDKTMITGTYKTNTGKPLKNTLITLNINGKKYTTKTYSSGKYFYKYQTNKVGTNKVTATYPGNSKYKAATTKTTFKVNKKGTRVKLNYIPPTAYSDKVTITGKFTNNKAKALNSATIILKINGKKYTTKTNAQGEFEYKYTANRIGTNYITAYFRGNDYYKYNSTKKTFKVNKKTTLLRVYEVYGELIDKHDKIIKNQKLYVNINNKKYTIKTDNYGGFNLENLVTNGLNKITISYPGNNIYKATKTSTTSKIRDTFNEPIIIISDTTKTKDKKYIKIQGKIYDYNGKMLENTPLKLILDGKTYYTNTDNEGTYTKYIKNNQIIEHSLYVIFDGNSIYKEFQEQIIFTTHDKEGEIEIATPLTSAEYDEVYNAKAEIKQLGTDKIISWHQVVTSRNPAGAYLELFSRPDAPARANEITSVTFYYKNRKTGDIITLTDYSDEYGYRYYSENIEGYTPYKTIVKYRHRTSKEITSSFHITYDY